MFFFTHDMLNILVSRVLFFFVAPFGVENRVLLTDAKMEEPGTSDVWCILDLQPSQQ